MADMRHRDGKLKIMHTIIGDFGKTLRQIAQSDLVESVLTGTISPSKSYAETLTFQYFTDNGIKLLAKTTNAVQEIFIVTATPELLLDELQKSGFVLAEREDVKHKGNKKKRLPPPNPNVADRIDNNSAKSKEADPLTLKQFLSPEALTALEAIKEKAKPKVLPTSPVNQSKKGKSVGKPLTKTNNKDERDEDFASLFSPDDEELSFEELLNQSKLDPKFFKD